jgi:hypothetical protein
MDKLITSKDAAKLCTPPVKPSTVRVWRSRFGDFPKPYDTFGDTPVYKEHEMLAWLRKHGRAS